jgi:flagellin-like hook-associated protein FlgL
LRYDGTNKSKLGKSLEKLSSGFAINRAGDNAAGLAVSEKMRAQLRGIEQAVNNAQDGISMVQTFEGALTESHNILMRMKTLAAQSANGTYDDQVDRAAIELEYEQLCQELDDISETDFNGIMVLDGAGKTIPAIPPVSPLPVTPPPQYSLDLSSLGTVDFRTQINQSLSDIFGRAGSILFNVKYTPPTNPVTLPSDSEVTIGYSMAGDSTAIVFDVMQDDAIIASGSYDYIDYVQMKNETVKILGSDGMTDYGEINLTTTDRPSLNTQLLLTEPPTINEAALDELAQTLSDISGGTATFKVTYTPPVSGKPFFSYPLLEVDKAEAIRIGTPSVFSITRQTNNDVLLLIWGGSNAANEVGNLKLSELKSPGDKITNVEYDSIDQGTFTVELVSGSYNGYDGSFRNVKTSIAPFSDVSFEVAYDTNGGIERTVIAGLSATPTEITAGDAFLAIDYAAGVSSASGSGSVPAAYKNKAARAYRGDASAYPGTLNVGTSFVGSPSGAPIVSGMEVITPRLDSEYMGVCLDFYSTTPPEINGEIYRAVYSDDGITLSLYLTDGEHYSDDEINALIEKAVRPADIDTEANSATHAATPIFFRSNGGLTMTDSSESDGYFRVLADDEMTSPTGQISLGYGSAFGIKPDPDSGGYYGARGNFEKLGGDEITVISEIENSAFIYYFTDDPGQVGAKYGNDGVNIILTLQKGETYTDKQINEFIANATSGDYATNYPSQFSFKSENGQITADTDVADDWRGLVWTKEDDGSGGLFSAADIYDGGGSDKVSVSGLLHVDSVSLQVGARTKDLKHYDFDYSGVWRADNTLQTKAIGELEANINASAGGLGLVTDEVNLSTQTTANTSIDKIDYAINKISMIRGTFGAIQNRLERKIDNLNTTDENLTAAESRIRDTDMSEEYADMTKRQILSQASQAMFAQANQLPQSVLQLIQG